MRVLARSVVLGLWLCVLAPATALAAVSDPPEKCYDLDRNGQLPTCTYDGSSWEVSYPDSGLGIPGWGVWLLILAVLAGLAVLVWRVALSRRIAREAGLDEGTTPRARG